MPGMQQNHGNGELWAWLQKIVDKVEENLGVSLSEQCLQTWLLGCLKYNFTTTVPGRSTKTMYLHS